MIHNISNKVNAKHKLIDQELSEANLEKLRILLDEVEGLDSNYASNV